ncbi:MAG: alanine racemase [Planctomycetota bacterium]|nr:alanine racemase [Planctomycetota bacterium]
MAASKPTPLDPDLAERILTPALLIDLGAARRNIDAVLSLTAGPARWRPHVKTAKVPEVLALYAQAGIRRFKCATPREAEVLAAVLEAESTPSGDILLAHHVHGRGLERLSELSARWPAVTFSTLAESVEQVVEIPPEVGVFVDIDLGMARTGIDVQEGDEVRAIARAAGDRFRGLHAYDGHRHEADLEERSRRIHSSYDDLVALSGALRDAGHSPSEVVTAGTPAFPAALKHIGLATLPGSVHRVSPGTVIYHDLRSVEQLPDLKAEFAATVLTRVASLPGANRVTCDAGSKSIEGTGPDRIAEVLDHAHLVARGQSEEHTIFEATGSARPARGSLLRLIPGHVCPTVNLATHVLLLEDGRLVGRAEVAARGHEALA